MNQESIRKIALQSCFPQYSSIDSLISLKESDIVISKKETFWIIAIIVVYVLLVKYYAIAPISNFVQNVL